MLYYIPLCTIMLHWTQHVYLFYDNSYENNYENTPMNGVNPYYCPFVVTDIFYHQILGSVDEEGRVRLNPQLVLQNQVGDCARNYNNWKDSFPPEDDAKFIYIIGISEEDCAMDDLPSNQTVPQFRDYMVVLAARGIQNIRNLEVTTPDPANIANTTEIYTDGKAGNGSMVNSTEKTSTVDQDSVLTTKGPKSGPIVNDNCTNKSSILDVSLLFSLFVVVGARFLFPTT